MNSYWKVSKHLYTEDGVTAKTTKEYQISAAKKIYDAMKRYNMVDFNKLNEISYAKRVIHKALDDDKWEDAKLKDILTLLVAKHSEQIASMQARIDDLETSIEPASMQSHHGENEDHPMKIEVHDENAHEWKYLFKDLYHWTSKRYHSVKDAIVEYMMAHRPNGYLHFIDEEGELYAACVCGRQVKINGGIHETT